MTKTTKKQIKPEDVEERITSLPKWAQQYIAKLQARVKNAEATIPWTEPGMEWFTLLTSSQSETIFTCSERGTHPIATIGKDDRVFVGRAPKDHKSLCQ